MTAALLLSELRALAHLAKTLHSRPAAGLALTPPKWTMLSDLTHRAEAAIALRAEAAILAAAAQRAEADRIIPGRLAVPPNNPAIQPAINPEAVAAGAPPAGQRRRHNRDAVGTIGRTMAQRSGFAAT